MFEEILNGNRDESIIQQYNETATKQFKEEVLERCDGCGRTFQPEALIKHQKMCLKGKSQTEDDMLSLLTQKPKSLVCYICGREFGTTSLEIHLKTCKKKWDWEQDQKPPEERRPLPEPPENFEAIMAGNYDDSMME